MPDSKPDTEGPDHAGAESRVPAITGQVTASVDVIAAGKSLIGHQHTGNLGAPTSPPL